MRQNLKAIYHSIRPLNLLIAAITMSVAYYCILVPGNDFEGLGTSLNTFNFTLLVLSTVAIMAAGNLVNDLADVNGDRVNKKRALVAGIGTTTAISWYTGLNLTGIFLAIWVCGESGNFYLLSLQLTAVVLLLFYSTHLKAIPLAGNLAISLLCATVPFIPLIYDKASLLPDAGTSHIMISYLSIFAFILTLMREMVKDLEDAEGDEAEGVNTFSVVFGAEAARRTIFVFGVFLLTLLFSVIYMSYDRYPVFTAFTFIFELLPAGITCRNILKSENKMDFSHISNAMKMIMIAGIGSMVLLHFERQW